jgi:hypothetical protein
MKKPEAPVESVSACSRADIGSATKMQSFALAALWKEFGS